MTDSSLGYTTTDLIVTVSQVLLEGGYRQIDGGFPEWSTPTSRLFEDEYSVVGIAIFETCNDLMQAWPDVQAMLVDVISRYVGSQESKSWDGYLVLLTPGLASSESDFVERVRYDTTRLRKLVATGDDLKLPTDVERVVQPLLPLRPERVSLGQESALDLLPKLLAAQQIPQEVTQVLVDSFRQQSPLLEQLHRQRGEE
jgi:hypothetical protein